MKPRLAKWLRERHPRFANWWARPNKTPNGRILLGIAGIVLAFTASFALTIFVNRDGRERDRESAAFNLWIVEHEAWEDQRDAFVACGESIERGDAIRLQFALDAQGWHQLADIFEEGGANPQVVQLLHDQGDLRTNGPFLATEPKTIADCGEVGPEPSDPRD